MQPEDRYLRIYCLTHGVSFTVLGGSVIVCASGGESLAQNFPQEEFWEYCCDCQSFWPSSLAKGAKAPEQCLVCERQIKRRFICDRCKVISLDSSEENKRKTHKITVKGDVEPACPGCLKAPGAALHLHLCDEIVAEFSTAHTTCPFCHEQLTRPSRLDEKTLRLNTDYLDVISGGAIDDRALDAQQITCPRCGTAGTRDNRFCRRCGYALNSDAALLAQGSETTVHVLSTVTSPPARSYGPTSGASTSHYSGVAAADSGSNYTEAASTTSVARPLLVAALILVMLIIGILSALLMQANSRTKVSTNSNTDSSTTYLKPTPVAPANASKKSSTPLPTPAVQSSPVITQNGPTANARLAYCRSNNVYVRSSPYLDETKANVIKVINRDQKMWVLSTSSNYDTAYIRSAGGNVTDNWTEVQLYDDASVRGWVFSYFVQY